MAAVRITLFPRVNGQLANTGGKAVIVPASWPEFLAACSKKLGVDVTRIYTAQGGEVDDVSDILANDVLYADVPSLPSATPAPSAAAASAAAPAPSGSAAAPFLATGLEAGGVGGGAGAGAPLKLEVGLQSAKIECLNVESGDNESELQITVSCAGLPRRENLLVICADQSGSMRPSWNQVQAALVYIMGNSYADPSIIVQCVLYNQDAGVLYCTPQDFETKISKKNANGKTCFASMFDKCKEVVNQEVALRGPGLEITICLLTDGAHTTERNAGASFRSLQTYLQKLPNRSTVHCLGFTEGHKFEDLDRIRRELGKNEGGFQYAEPNMGMAGLKTKLEAVFETVAQAGATIEYTVEIPGFEFCVPGLGAACLLPRRLEGSTTVSHDGLVNITIPVRALTADRYGQPAECHIILRQGPDILAEVVGPVTINQIAGEVAASLHALLRLSKDVDETGRSIKDMMDTYQAAQPPAAKPGAKPAAKPSAKAAAAATKAHKDIDRSMQGYGQAIQRMRQELKQFESPSVFRLPQAARTRVLTLRARISDRITNLNEVVGAWARGTWTSAAKGRLAEIVHGALFTHARRRRRMDERAQRNSRPMMEEMAQVDTVPTDEDALAAASEESKDLFSCVLSLNDWTDVRRDRDIVGLGIGVSRPEWAVDDPTQVRMMSLGTTIISKSAMEDAIKHGIDVKGHEGTTGGFDKNATGSALPGRGRENVNAFLPLYIHPAHWDVGTKMAKGCLGYLVALDPLGYGRDQIDTMFLALGSMVANLDQHQPGERELLMIFQLQRTLYQLASELDWFPRMEEAIRHFRERELARDTCQVKNLLVLVAYMLVLPTSLLDKIFKRASDWVDFWGTILRVSMRRAAFTLCSNFKGDALLAFLQIVVEGMGPGETTELSQQQADDRVCAALPSLAPIQVAINTAAEEATDIDEGKKDAAAETQLSRVIANPFTSEAVANLAEGDLPEFRPERVTNHMITLINKFAGYMNQLNSGGFPTGMTLTTLHTFAVQWWTIAHEPAPEGAAPVRTALQHLDARFGVAPDHWVRGMKTAFANAQVHVGAGNGSLGAVCNLIRQYGAIQVDAQGDQFPANIQILRAMLSHGVRFRVNRVAREAVESGFFQADTLRTPNDWLTRICVEIRTERDSRISSLVNSRLNQMRYNDSINAEDDDDFARHVTTLIGASRFKSNQWKPFLRGLGAQGRVRNAEGKIKMLVSGRVYRVDESGRVITYQVFDGAWTPGKVYNNMFRRMLTTKLSDLMKSIVLDDILAGFVDNSRLLEFM